jgi:fructokinase
MTNSIVCFGEVLWDTFESGKKPGGAPMNVAMHLKQQGLNAMIATSVGIDTTGEDLIKFLKDSEIYSSIIQRDTELETCVVTVKLDEKQQATYTIPSPVSWDNICIVPELVLAADEASVIVFGSLACRHDKTKNTLIHLLQNSKALKVFDINLRAPHYSIATIKELAMLADIIKVNDEELDILTSSKNEVFSLQDKIIHLADIFACTKICVTRGDKGAIIFYDGDFYDHTGYVVNVVDTVGSGDAFLATFIGSLLKNLEIGKALDEACCMGAFVASNRGANPIYNLEAINKIRYSS